MKRKIVDKINCERDVGPTDLEKFALGKGGWVSSHRMVMILTTRRSHGKKS